jgi:chromosome partitioning protein
MRIIVFASQKGGAGKTTLAIHMAILALQEGKRVVLIDLDPQASATMWWDRRSTHDLKLIDGRPDNLEEILNKIKADGCDLAIIDTPPQVEQNVQTAIGFADFTLIPCRPSLLDLQAVGSTIEIVTRQNKRGAVILNSCPPANRGAEQSITKEAREGVAKYGLPVAPMSISQRVAFGYALIDGLAVTEYEPDGKAADELKSLWKWLSASV